jgi:probable rRNA maturation factor
MPKINFFTEDISFNLKQRIYIRNWIQKVVLSKGAKLNEINYIFCSDEYLKVINKEYLNHDYYTDIITFDNSEEENQLEGDIYISIDRVKENSKQFGKTFENELHRVMIHGILHLIGYADKTKEEAEQMRHEEEASLLLFPSVKN